MRRWIALLTVIALGSFVSGNAIADDRDDDDERERRHERSVGPETFVGLWQAIDSFDGSTQLLSITCAGKYRCDVRLNDTAFTLSCENQIGFARGVGRIKGGELQVDLALECHGAKPEDNPAPQFNRFVPDRRNRTLTNLNDDPSVPNIFHRISR
jgi:hypothetical protein